MAADQDRLSHLIPRIALYVAFAVTGAVTNLLGPILPALEQDWRIGDQQAGELFTFQFAFSTLASIFASRNPRLSAPLGMMLAACGVFLLSSGGMQTARIAVSLYGAGLGLAITSMNLLVAGESLPGRKSFEIAMLNFIWVVGAISFPLLYSQWSRSGRQGLLSGIAWLALASGVAVALQFPLVRGTLSPTSLTDGFRPLSLLFALFFFLYVGVEVGVAGWLPTYVDRATHQPSGATALAVFWGALLAGRFLLPMLLRRLQHRTLLFLFLAVALISTLLLSVFRNTPTLLLASGIVGLGFGPLFPLNLAMFAHTIPDHKNSGWVLACAGLGAAVLPALMGIVSQHSGSFRVAITVPLIAIVALFAIAMIYREPPETGHLGA